MKSLAKLILFLSPLGSLHAAGDGVKVTADQITSIGGLPISNSMVTSWIISLLLIIFIKVLVGKPQLIPSKGQLILESVIGGIRGIIEPIVGKKVFFPSCLLYTSPSPRDRQKSRMPSSA